MKTDQFLSLVRQLIGKDLVTEDDSPSDFSMGGTSDVGSTGTDTSTVSSTTTTTNTTTDDTSSSDNSTIDLGLDNSNTGGAGLTPTYDVNVDMDDDNNANQQPTESKAPKYRILDVIFDDDDDLNTKVKIQNIDDGKTEVKRLDEIII